MKDLFTRLRSFLDGEVFRGSSKMFAVRLAGAAAGVLMFALLSRQMVPLDFDSLVVTFNAVSFLAAIALCGQETLIIRSWGEYCGSHRPALALGVLAFSAAVALAAGLIVSLVTLAVWHVWGEASFWLQVGACSFLLSQSAMHYSGQWSRVAAGIVIGDGHREVTWKLIVIAVIVGFTMGQVTISEAGFFFAAAVGLLISVAVQLLQTRPLIPVEVMKAKPEFNAREWVPRSFRMWLAALLDTSGQYLEVLLVAVVLGPPAAAGFFIAPRISNLFVLISTSIANYATSRISHLYFSGSQAALQETLKSLAALGAGLLAAGLVLVILSGKILLWIFGAQFVSVYPVLVILSIGASLGALAGPAAQVLLLTGHEGIYPRVASVALALRFSLIAVLGALFGLEGVAVAWSIGTALLAFILIVCCRRLVGLDPSFLALISRHPRPQIVEG